MARNEEKQLARLNRFYLQKQKEEELKKRPPRPKLETLTTAEEVTKWLPSITRDMEFYVKQMEVPCYQDQQIEEFSRRIGHLKGEYKAFLRKLHQLNPENKITPWTDRPYAIKRQKVSAQFVDLEEKESKTPHDIDEQAARKNLSVDFTPLATPVLDNDDLYKYSYGYEKPVKADCPDLSEESMNQPLEFAPMPHLVSVSSKDVDSYSNSNNPRGEESSPHSGDDAAEKFSPSQQNSATSRADLYSNSLVSNRGLNLPYSDSSSSGDET